MQNRLDLPTIAAISIVAYIIQNVLHEAVGHGAACLLLGGEPVALSTAYFDMVGGAVSDTGRRLIAAGGTIVNIVAGGAFWLAYRTIRSSSSPVRYFLWLSMTINLMSGTGYFLFSGLVQVGDWIVVIDGLEPHLLWSLMLVVVGIVTYGLSIWLALSTMVPLLGNEQPDRMKRAFRLSFHPYMFGSLASSIGAVFNPISPVYLLTSIAANFGGTSGLAWMTRLYNTSWFAPSDSPPLEIPRSWAWIIVAGMGLSVHIAVLGPSISF